MLQEDQLIFTWQGLRAARFDHGGTRAAAVIYPHPGGLNVPSGGDGGGGGREGQAWGAQVRLRPT